MATGNPFDLLGDDDNDDPSRLIAIQQQKVAAAAAKKPAAPAAAPSAGAKFPSKPAPPSQAVKEARNNAAPPMRGGQGRGFFGRGGRGGNYGAFGGSNKEFANGDLNGFAPAYGTAAGGEELDAGKPSERGRGGYGSRGSYRGGRRGGYPNEEGGGDSERPPAHRMYDRRSGTGRGYGMKRDGAGRGNWGTTKDDVITELRLKLFFFPLRQCLYLILLQVCISLPDLCGCFAVLRETEVTANVEEKVVSTENQLEQEIAPNSEETKVNKETQANEGEEKEPEDKEMTLDEYEKIREEKRKALLAMKAEERKVEVDKEFLSMQPLSTKKGNDEIFVKLGTGKDVSKKKDIADREERAKKAMNITEFLKPAEGERYYAPGGRGRGRGRGRGDSRGGYSRGDYGNSGGYSRGGAPAIEDSGEFPSLAAK